MIRRSVVLALAAIVCACGQAAERPRTSQAASLTVNQTQEEIAEYLRAISQREPVAEGVRQRVRDGDDEAVITADLIDISSGNVIGAATYTLTPAGEETRITLQLSRMTGLYADVGRQEILSNRIMALLRRDLGDV